VQREQANPDGSLDLTFDANGLARDHAVGSELGQQRRGAPAARAQAAPCRGRARTGGPLRHSGQRECEWKLLPRVANDS
jgi:hypothetical protein